MAPWACVRDGKCCTEPRFVVMTHAERRLLTTSATHLPKNALQWRAADHPAFVKLVARPCPLYDADAQGCTVYDVRPFNCRRFGCMRSDVATEPFPAGGVPVILERAKAKGVDHLADTLRGLDALHQADAAWALAHGWKAHWT